MIHSCAHTPASAPKARQASAIELIVRVGAHSQHSVSEKVLQNAWQSAGEVALAMRSVGAPMMMPETHWSAMRVLHVEPQTPDVPPPPQD